MPRGDGTGPLGQGPMTGRGMGFCVLKLPDGDSPTQEMPGHAAHKTHTFRESGQEVTTMPAGDGTGPTGLGPMTGRAVGYCAGYPVPGYANPIPGRGFPGRLFAPAYYGPSPYSYAPRRYGYGAGYSPVWPRPFGWFGRVFGRGLGRSFGRGRGRGRRLFGW